MPSSSARASSATPAAASNEAVSQGRPRSARRSILRRWPKAWATTRRIDPRFRGSDGFGERDQLDECRGHARRRHEGSRRHVEQSADPIAPLRHDREPAIGLGAGRGGEAIGDLLLEHHGQALELRGPRLPFEEQLRGDVVGQVGDDLGRSGHDARFVDLEGVGRDHAKATGEVAGELVEGREATPVALDGDDLDRARRQQLARQAAGPGADLEHPPAVQRARRADDAADQVAIVQEVLAQRSGRADAVPRHDLAQRLDAIAVGQDGRYDRRRRAAISAASRIAAIKLPARAAPVPAMSSAVP